MNGQWCLDEHNWLKWYALNILQQAGAKCGIDWWPSANPQPPAVPRRLRNCPQPAGLDVWQSNLLRPLSAQLKKAGLVQATSLAGGNGRGFARLKNCDVVLLDPDIGCCVQCPTHKRAGHQPRKKGDQYVHADEIQRIRNTHHLLIYQHGVRQSARSYLAKVQKAVAPAGVRYVTYKGSGLLLIDGCNQLGPNISGAWVTLPTTLKRFGF